MVGVVPDLSQRVENLEKKTEKHDERYTQILETLAELKQIVKTPHPCKWDNVVPVLVEFKKNTDPIRTNIFKRLDTADENIDSLKEEMAMVKENNKLLKTLINEIQSNKDKEDSQSFSLKQGILLVLLGSGLGFIFSLIILIIK